MTTTPPKSDVAAAEAAPFRIVVLPRGWVLIGRYHAAADGTFTLIDAAVIRRWGTTRGLGELYAGPRGATQLDPCVGIVRGLTSAVLFTIGVDQHAWRTVLAS